MSMPTRQYISTNSSSTRPPSLRRRLTADPRDKKGIETAAAEKAARVVVPDGMVKMGTRAKELVPPPHHGSKQGKWKLPVRLTETDEQQAERKAKPLQSNVRDGRKKGKGLQKLDIENARNYNKLSNCPINSDIDPDSTIRLLLPDGNNEVMPFEDAMQIAQKMDLDLVQWASKGSELICKLMDFGDELTAAKQKDYEEKKESKRKVSKTKKILPEKEMRFGSGIGDNDFRMKIRKAAGFLDKGHPLMLHVELRRSGSMDQEQRAKRALELLVRATEMLADVGTEMAGQKKIMLGQIRNKYAPLSEKDKAKIEKAKDREFEAEQKLAEKAAEARAEEEKDAMGGEETEKPKEA